MGAEELGSFVFLFTQAYSPSTMKGLLFLCVVLVSANMILACNLNGLLSCVESAESRSSYDPCGGGFAMLDCFPDNECTGADLGVPSMEGDMRELLDMVC